MKNSIEEQFFPFWSVSSEEIFQKFKTSREGLTLKEASFRLKKFGPNTLKSKKKSSSFFLFLEQFKSPLILLLLACSILAWFLSEATDALIILAIILLSALLGFIQEKGALHAVEKLLRIVQVKAVVLREGKEEEIPKEHVVLGDILVLNAGDVISADALILEANHFFVDESALTGESMAVEKQPGKIVENTPLAKRTNSVFMGTHVISGTAKAVAAQIGKGTEFGRIAEHLSLPPPKTAFEIGVQKFGYFLMRLTFLFVLVIFGVNAFLKRQLLDSFLFALALGVGFTPQLLPAIITVNLSHGARFLARKKVIAKRLSAIENFGSMDILCCDKTGTLTKGEVEVDSYADADGNKSEKTILYASLNASLQAGYTNPLDFAILKYHQEDLSSWKKLDEVPYDFKRKRITILAAKGSENVLITKGAFQTILPLCSKMETQEGKIVDLAPFKEKLHQLFQEHSSKGYRLLAVAYLPLPGKSSFREEEEKDLIFLGYVQFSDPVKPHIRESLEKLKKLGVHCKIITGDNPLVAAHMAEEIGFSKEEVLRGEEISRLSDIQLQKEVLAKNVFAEIEPLQKERIILSLRKAGHIVGFLGDGINDVGAIHSADVGISVDHATDVAKEAADFILLERDLDVLEKGVQEGRRTFANTLKYILMATSANFGNMFSMAGVSFFLSFLPLLPKQILLNNLLTDVPELAISTDRVDEEFLQSPQKWDIGFIRKFMIPFGLISSVFDFLTFGLLLFLTDSVELFRTGWFVESVFSAAFIIFAIRTRRPLLKSRPGKALSLAILGIILLTCLLPYTPLSKIFGFTPLPPLFIAFIAGIVLLYTVAVEIAKKIFYRRARV